MLSMPDTGVLEKALEEVRYFVDDIVHSLGGCTVGLLFHLLFHKVCGRIDKLLSLLARLVVQLLVALTVIALIVQPVGIAAGACAKTAVLHTDAFFFAESLHEIILVGSEHMSKETE